MFGSFLSSLGGHIGSAFGGGIFSSVGRYAGRLLGEYIDNRAKDVEERVTHKGQILNNLYVQSSAYGRSIALIYGKAKIAGNIIWAEPIEETLNETVDHKYYARRSKEVITHNYEFKYYLSFAVAICEGEIEYIERVWVGDEIIDLSLYNYRLYKGGEEQLPDSLIERDMGVGKTPAFRGLCYIIFERLPLIEFGNKVPNFIFEVVRTPKVTKPELLVENLINSMVMIPGSGEFVYDTIVQYKYKYLRKIQISHEAINCHNPNKEADAIYSLNSLQKICKNVKWVAPVVCWFGNNLNIAQCEIYPAVEYHTNGVVHSEEWTVAGVDRHNARLISRNEFDSPNYGGTVNDASLLRYLDELKRRGLKVLFNPMFFLDIEGKPWRGHVTGDPQDVEIFFRKPNGYNNFILHYARLVKGKVDAFIIGSELKSITTISSGNGEFPAVKELVLLARQVKEILGSYVKVSYAADWSEYHHESNGWFHLDELWSSEYIDFIAIDAYFPLTESNDSSIDSDDIRKGWQSGEGYDYYYDNKGSKHPLNQNYAWKNIKYWWENFHYHPNGVVTSWQPKSKKIWFTEFGFPSVDKASNQPNIFYDPKCVDGGLPKYSQGDIDFAIQKKAIKASIEAINSLEFIENVFLWCWDARPYPAWPHASYWSDGYLWERGHWVSGKFGLNSLAAIITDLCLKGNININQIDVTEISDSVQGLVLDNPLTIADTIHMLRCAYFFDFKMHENQIKFSRRGDNYAKISIDINELIIEGGVKIETSLISEQHQPSNVKLTFLDPALDYEANHFSSCYDFPNSHTTYSVNLPLILSYSEAESITHKILLNARGENKYFNFKLPLKYIFLRPSNKINITDGAIITVMRIIEIVIEEITISINAVVEGANYNVTANPLVNDLPNNMSESSYLEIISLPITDMKRAPDEMQLLIALYSRTKEKLYLSLNGYDYIKVDEFKSNAVVATVVYYKNNCLTPYIIDNSSELLVYTESTIYEVLEQDLWSRAKLILLGQEVIAYRTITKIENKIYKLQGFIRSLYSTPLQNSIENGTTIMIITEPRIQSIFNVNKSKTLFFRTPFSEQRALKITDLDGRLKGAVIRKHHLENKVLHLSWYGINTYEDNWHDPYISEAEFYRVEVKFEEKIIHLDKCKNEKISIDFNNFSISGRIEIFIIAEAIGRKESLPVVVTIEI
jgi:hypothetical protein